MRTTTARIGSAGALLSLLSVAAPAQDRVAPEGAWIGLEAGYASGSCGWCSSSARAPSGSIVVAGAVTERLGVGAEWNVWANSTDQISSASAVVYVFPDAEAGFVFQGGLGFSKVPSRARGLAALAGVSYHTRLGPNFLLAPSAHLRYSVAGRRLNPRRPDGRSSFVVLDVGLGLIVSFGRL